MVTAPSPLRIGVMGANSTGKTTLLQRIEGELRGHGITVARTGKLGRRAASLGLPKVQHHTAAFTEWIIAQGIADEIAAAAHSEHSESLQAVLADRPARDALAYYRAAQIWRRGRPDRPEHDRLTQAPKYSLLLAFVLDPALPLAGNHGRDGRYRTLVDRHTHRLLAEQDIPNERVTSDPNRQAHAVELAIQLCLTEATS